MKRHRYLFLNLIKGFLSIVFLILVVIESIAIEYRLPFYPPYYSQCGQDKYLQEKIFRSRKHGVFVEIGAHDGITRSNTYFFERNFGWTGICIEPHPDRFAELVKNRAITTVCLPIAVANFTGVSKFKKISGYAEMLSGLEDNYDLRHSLRIEQELKQFGGEIETIDIRVEKLGDILSKLGVVAIDLLSIDTEGSELEILKSIDFDLIKVEVIVVENAYSERLVENYLKSKQYLKVTNIDCDDVYIRKWN